MIYLALAAWGGFCWRARGGGLADATGFRFWGTSATRAIFACLMVLPLLPLTWRALLLIPALWGGWSLAGWGAFQDMGADRNIERPNPVGSLFSRLKPLAHDMAGMVVEGLICMALPAVAVAVAHPSVRALVVLLCGPLFALLVLTGDRLPLPTLGRFLPAAGWREVLVGAMVEAVLWWGLG